MLELSAWPPSTCWRTAVHEADGTANRAVDHLLTQIAAVFFGLLAIMNPVANMPVFLGLTEGASSSDKTQIARRAVGLAFVIVLVSCLLGQLIFEAFGITLTAFRITGGILVFAIGYRMLQGEHSSVHHPTPEDNASRLADERDVAVSPLAIPILAGPGTIATAMNFSAPGAVSTAITLACFAVLCLITYVCFRSAQKLTDYLGQSALNVITRIMGLILAVIGTQMFIDGASEVVKSLR